MWHFYWVTQLNLTLAFSGYTLTNNNSKQGAVYFDDIFSRNIDAIEGQTVIIPCTVRNLSRDKVVSHCHLIIDIPRTSV